MATGKDLSAWLRYPLTPTDYGKSFRSEDYGEHRRTDSETHGSSAGASGGAESPGTWVPTPALSFSGAGGYPHPRKDTLESTGLRAGEMIGWRAWFSYAPPVLNSTVFSETVWSPNESVQGDVWQESDSIYTVSQGVHAFKSIGGAKTHIEECLWGFQNGGRNTPMVYAIGTVFMWGDIVEHSNGYRSEFASIRSIDLAGALHWEIKSLSFYGESRPRPPSGTIRISIMNDDAIATYIHITPVEGGTSTTPMLQDYYGVGTHEEELRRANPQENKER